MSFIYNNTTINNKLDKIISFCLILYAFTFLLDFKINFLTTAFAFGIIKLFFIKPNIKINSKILYFIAAFILCTSLSIFLNDVKSLSLINLTDFKSRFLSPLIGFLLIFLFKFTKQRILILFSSFSFSLLLNAIYIIYQASQGESGRLIGFASNYMLLCGINVLILPVIFSLALHKSNIPYKLRLFYLLTALINIPAIILENTRIVWIAIGISYLLIILLALKNKFLSLILILIILFSSFLFFKVSPESIARFNSITNISYQNQSNYERLLMWQSAKNMFIEHPFFGVGIGNYHEQYMNNYRSPYSREDQWHPHNVPLAMLSETGIIGGISYFALFAYLYFHAISSYIKKKNLSSFAYLMCLISYTINCLTDCMFCGYNIKMPTTIFYLFTGIYLFLNKFLLVNFKK
ncbi:O-antigen ligase family protein [Megamonas funiformis]|uniref:O-antigen ligase family protein n=1 Tax=Megamonas funiformis TaxID=437897 RepID=UPI0024ADD557|nr:O-antigen ligase family protein [Megamonas funiformis]